MAKIAEEAKKRTSAAAGKAMGTHNKSYQGTWKGTGGDPWLYSMDDAGNISIWDTRDTAAGWKTLEPGSGSYNAVIEFIANPVTEDGATRLERVSDRPHSKEGESPDLRQSFGQRTVDPPIDEFERAQGKEQSVPPAEESPDLRQSFGQRFVDPPIDEFERAQGRGESTSSREAPFELPAQSDVPYSDFEIKSDPLKRARTHSAADKAAIAKHRKKSKYHKEEDKEEPTKKSSGFFQNAPWAASNEPGPGGQRGA